MTKPSLSAHATDHYRADIDGLRAAAVRALRSVMGLLD
jgi:hypothetical protein